MTVMKRLLQAVAIQMLVQTAFSFVDEGIRLFIRKKGEEFFSRKEKES